MNCMEARALVEDALDESLAGSRKRALDLHLSRCDACRAVFDAERAEHRRWFLAMNESGARRRLPQGFAEDFLADVAERHAKPQRRWAFLAAFRRVAAVLLAMAAFAGLVYAAASGLRGTVAASGLRGAEAANQEAANQGDGSRLSSDVSGSSEASVDQFVKDDSSTQPTQPKGEQTMKPKKAMTAVLAAAAATLATVAPSQANAVGETTDFWDTSGRSADVTSSVVSSGDASAYFETEHESSSEVSVGRNINTFPSTGVIFIVW